MVSKRQRLAVLAVVVVVIVASLAVIAIELTKGPTEAEMMMLNPKDLGDGWISVNESPVNVETYPNVTSFCNRQVQNTTIGIHLIVFVFATENDSERAFTELSSSMQNDSYGSTSSLMHVTPQDVLCYFEHNGYPSGVLLSGKTMIEMGTDEMDFTLQSWYGLAFIRIAMLQSGKIDHCLNR